MEGSTKDSTVPSTFLDVFYDSDEMPDEEPEGQISQTHFEELKTNFDLKQLLKIQKEYFVFNYGSNIKDLYSFRKILGEGGYGKVYKAKHRKSNQSRAIKTIPKNKIINVDRFKNEVDALKKLDHPNVIKLQDIYEDSTRVYL